MSRLPVELPCCGQYAKVYRRQITSTMARKLIAAYRRFGTAEWFRMPELVRSLGIPSRDESHLATWGLIEEATEKREDGGRAGWWRVTEKGRLFVLRQAWAAKYVSIYDGRVLGFSVEQVDIQDALGTRFDYNELMGR